MAGDARSGLVRLLKVALPLAALGLAAAVFVIQRGDRLAGVDIAGLGVDLSQGLRLAAPVFTGRTPDGLPFRATAEWALPDGPDPERVGLGPLEGQIDLDAARRLTLTAAGGEIMPKTERVLLQGGVEARTSDGWRLRVESAEIDLATQEMRGVGPVTGAGPGGELEAGAMRAVRRGESQYLWFEDRVRVRIDPARVPGRGVGQ